MHDARGSGGATIGKTISTPQEPIGTNEVLRNFLT
jgi:hypothetical protein